MNVPPTWRGVRNRLLDSPPDVQSYFHPVEDLIEYYPWEVSLSYLFSRVERAHVMALYCGVVKIHRTDNQLAKSAVDRFENRREEFLKLFENIYGKKIPKVLIDKLEKAQNIRNRVLHGKKVKDKDFRLAIVAIIEYASGFNQHCRRIQGIPTFVRSLQGFTGATSPLDKSTSRWVLKGIGLPLD